MPVWAIFCIFRLCSRVFEFVHAVFQSLSYIKILLLVGSTINVLWRNHKKGRLHAKKRKNMLFTLCSRGIGNLNYSTWVRDRGVVVSTFFVENKLPHLYVKVRGRYYHPMLRNLSESAKIRKPTSGLGLKGQHCEVQEKSSLPDFYSTCPALALCQI